MRLLLPFIYRVDPYFENLIEICSTNEITKTGVYIPKKHNKKLYSLFEKEMYFF